MFDADHYVPMLRGKQAEYLSLGLLGDSGRDAMTPLVELPPMAWEPEDDEEEEAPAAIDPSLAGVGRKLEQGWGASRPIFLELGLVPSSTVVGGGRHPISVVFDDARERGVQAIPVTNARRDAAFQDAVRAAVEQDGRGVCIRLDSEDFEDVASAANDARALLETLGVAIADADMVLDFGEIPAGQTGPMVLAAGAVIEAIPDIGDWRTLTWAGSSFPTVQNYQANSINTASRDDWVIWQGLRDRGASLTRVPAFGDYTVNGVQSAYDVSAAVYRSSPNLRYTTDTDYLVIKGRHPRHGHEQFNDICRVMIARSDFRGATLSAGDAYIDDCANGNDGPGNAMTWRRAGVTHHLEAVADQIASLS